MTNEEIDTLWFKAMVASIKAGDEFTRYRFADLVAAAEREACIEILSRTEFTSLEHMPSEAALIIRLRGGE